jgi:nucleoside phosphorylase
VETIRVLVVEDTDEKFADISNKFTDAVLASEGYKVKLQRARSYSSALILIDKQFFDVVVLDLMLPLADGGQDRNFDYAKTIYKTLVDKPGSGPFLIVGLSAFAKERYQEHFAEDEIFSIENYNSESWFPNVVGRIKFISRGRTGLKQYLSNNFEMDAILITARKRNEFDPVSQSLNWLPGTLMEDPRVSKFKNKFGIVKLTDGSEVRVGLICIGKMGLSTSAGVTAMAIQQFRPRFLAMVGMCCGFKSRDTTKLGDVVIARKTANWDEGKYQPRKTRDEYEDAYFHNRAIDKSPSKELVEKVEQVLEDRQPDIEKKVRDYYSCQDLPGISKKIKMPITGDCAIHFGQMVSGSSVVDNLSMIDKILERFPQAVALEMEAHSIYAALETMDGVLPETLVIKGVADHGDGKKKSAFQPIASVASTIVAMEMLEMVLSGVEPKAG